MVFQDGSNIITIDIDRNHDDRVYALNRVYIRIDDPAFSRQSGEPTKKIACFEKIQRFKSDYDGIRKMQLSIYQSVKKSADLRRERKRERDAHYISNSLRKRSNRKAHEGNNLFEKIHSREK